ADAAEEARVGERALQRVVLEPEGRAERLGRSGEDVDAARIERRERRTPVQDVERGALLRARLGQEERAVRKVERGEAELLRNGGSGLAPAKPPRDHQVDREEELAFERQHDALAEALDVPDAPPVRRRER